MVGRFNHKHVLKIIIIYTMFVCNCRIRYYYFPTHKLKTVWGEVENNAKVVPPPRFWCQKKRKKKLVTVTLIVI